MNLSQPIHRNQGFQTAISRRALSAPMKISIQLADEKRPLDQSRCLDFGSGRGFDAHTLDFESYDPNWGPTELPSGVFDFIFCNYVLNVIPPRGVGANP